MCTWWTVMSRDPTPAPRTSPSSRWETFWALALSSRGWDCGTERRIQGLHTCDSGGQCWSTSWLVTHWILQAALWINGMVVETTGTTDAAHEQSWLGCFSCHVEATCWIVAVSQWQQDGQSWQSTMGGCKGSLGWSALSNHCPRLHSCLPHCWEGHDEHVEWINQVMWSFQRGFVWCRTASLNDFRIWVWAERTNTALKFQRLIASYQTADAI